MSVKCRYNWHLTTRIVVCKNDLSIGNEITYGSYPAFLRYSTTGSKVLMTSSWVASHCITIGYADFGVSFFCNLTNVMLQPL